MAMEETPCPPYYAEPTHEKTLVFFTESYVRDSNEYWYQCIEGAYCNAPSFLGYNPPGEGPKWTKAWDRLDEGYPCNPSLETSISFGGAASSSQNDDGGGGIQIDGLQPQDEERRPTSQPTSKEDLPSLISGVVWYDANGDGRKNTLKNALSQSEKSAASRERGAGMSNMKVTLRQCGTDELLGVTYTFPRSLGLVGEGAVEVIDASYLDSIQLQEAENLGFSLGNDGLGVGNTDGELGYYSFRILPNQLPGEFYVVFESPPGYRLTGGSGDYWEVYRAATRDAVQPSKEAPRPESERNDSGSGVDGNNDPEAPLDRRLQKTIGTISKNDDATATENAVQTGESPQGGGRTDVPVDRRPRGGPVNHSGYHARSGCIPVRKSPTRIAGIDAGIVEDSWPLVPYQYASFVATVHFYVIGGPGPTGGRGGDRRLNVSLECRKYQKLKSEGVELEDIWGCDAGKASGYAAARVDVKELTFEEAELVSVTLKDFLDNTISRVWTVKLVELAHQEVTMLDGEEGKKEDGEGGDDRRELGSFSYEHHHPTSTITNTKHQRRRRLQQNVEIGNLELGFRIRAEYSTDKSQMDLTDIVVSSLSYGGDSFLSRLKSAMPAYFKPAGVVTVRDTLWKPEDDAKDEERVSSKDVDLDADGVVEKSRLENENGNDGLSLGAWIGIIAGSLVLVGFIVGLLLYRRRKKKGSVEDGGSSESQHSPQKKASSGGNKKWWQRKTAAMEGANSETKAGSVSKKGSEPALSDSDDGSSDWDDDGDDLSSRFYSDSSKFDPELRRQEVGGYSDDEDYDDYDDATSSQLYGGDSSFYSSEASSQNYNTQGTANDSYHSYGTESTRSGDASAVSRINSRSSPRTSAASSRRSRSIGSSAMGGSRSTTYGSSTRSNGSTIKSSMRSSGRMRGSSVRSSGSSRRKTRSSMRSSGRTNRTSGTSVKSSAADLYNSDRRWSASQADSSDYSTSRLDDNYSRSTRDSRSRTTSHNSFV